MQRCTVDKSIFNSKATENKCKKLSTVCFVEAEICDLRCYSCSFNWLSALWNLESYQKEMEMGTNAHTSYINLKGKLFFLMKECQNLKKKERKKK